MLPVMAISCGDAHEWLQYCYRVPMRTSLDLPPVVGRWVPAGAGAKIVPVPTPFVSRWWEDDLDKPNSGLGEQWPTDWVRRCGFPVPVKCQAACYDGTRLGSLAVWENGGRVGVDPLFQLDAQGRPVDCPSPLNCHAVVIPLAFALPVDEMPTQCFPMGCRYAVQVPLAIALRANNLSGDLFGVDLPLAVALDVDAGGGMTHSVEIPPAFALTADATVSSAYPTFVDAVITPIASGPTVAVSLPGAAAVGSATLILVTASAGATIIAPAGWAVLASGTASLALVEWLLAYRIFVIGDPLTVNFGVGVLDELRGASINWAPVGSIAVYGATDGDDGAPLNHTITLPDVNSMVGWLILSNPDDYTALPSWLTLATGATGSFEGAIFYANAVPGSDPGAADATMADNTDRWTSLEFSVSP